MDAGVVVGVGVGVGICVNITFSCSDHLVQFKAGVACNHTLPDSPPFGKIIIFQREMHPPPLEV